MATSIAPFNGKVNPGGFAAGTLLGMYLSDLLSRRVVQATVICEGPRKELEVAVREAGFALTGYEGMGRDGAVNVIGVVCSAQQTGHLIKAANQVAPGHSYTPTSWPASGVDTSTG